VSVVLPTFDSAATLRRSVLSVLGQTMTNLELIVIDDGSTDDTRAVLSAITDPRMSVIHQPQQGVSSARNAGIGAARGTIITFLDSDDEAIPTWLEQVVGPFDDPLCMMVCTGIRSVDRTTGRDEVRMPAPASRHHHVPVLFLPGAFAIRRNVLDDTGGYLDGLAYSENTELGIRLLASIDRLGGRIESVPVALVVMHRDRSGRAARHRSESILRILDEHGELFRSDPDRIARWLSIAAVDLAKDRQLRTARRLFVKAWWAQPFRLDRAARVIASALPPVARRVWRPTAPSRRTASPSRAVESGNARDREARR
jgi:glycosyltransferase involved in cell wall biosynthesis